MRTRLGSILFLVCFARVVDECEGIVGRGGVFRGGIVTPGQLLSMKLEDIEYSFTNNDFLIFGMGRSGTNLLVELLNQRLQISTANELFGSTSYSYTQLRNRFLHLKEEHITDLAEVAKGFKLIFKYGWWNFKHQFVPRVPSKLFGFKCFGQQLANPTWPDFLTNFGLANGAGKLKIIHIQRDNFVLGALSMAEAKVESKYSYKDDDVRSNSSILDWSDPNTSQQVVEYALIRCLRIQYYDRDLKKAEKRGLISLHPIHYEDLVQNQERVLDGMNRFLTGQPLPSSSQTQKTKNQLGRSTIDASVRIPNLHENVHEMMSLLLLFEVALPSQFLEVNTVRLCKLKIEEQFLQLVGT